MYIYIYIFSYVFQVLELRGLYISVRACVRPSVRSRRGTPTLCTGIVVCLCQLRHSAAVGVYLEIALVIYSVFELPTLKV